MDSYDDYEKWSPIDGATYPDYEIIEWEDRVNLNNPIIALLSPLYHPGDYSNTAMPTDWQRTTTWMWESSPFQIRPVNSNGMKQAQPGDFTSPYWIGRFLNFSTIALS